MNKIAKITIASLLVIGFSTAAQANNRGVDGLIIGSGAGAIMGQAIGRNAEATIVGATVGGILGAVIGSESSRHHTSTVIVREQPNHRYYAPPHRHYYEPRGPRVVYQEPRHIRYRDYPRHAPQRVFSKPCRVDRYPHHR